LSAGKVLSSTPTRATCGNALPQAAWHSSKFFFTVPNVFSQGRVFFFFTATFMLLLSVCEATSKRPTVLGYLCNRLDSFMVGNIDFSQFAYNTVCSFLGAKHPDHFVKSPNPPNILTCMDKSDDFLRTNFKMSQKKCFRDNYDWLSEFAHASNFLSHSSSFTVDLANKRFVFRHDAKVQERDFQLIDYLEGHAGIFIIFFDHLSRKLERGISG
jgi:hypothetical protein